ncbi:MULTISPECIES: hypothetical protein [unclassified Janthinobacterium]|uniref:hypothetical protein n=1 Tax=unclassified Janthinobacterium TaxID=2610881 RepID=UPI000345410C|nr:MULTISPECIES: hypothetical protein [unclassified Janthinobacterium]MEC5161724.1 GNAT superfamily N-acetyltransferase [Janthinobacterium sp. CG_S6]
MAVDNPFLVALDQSAPATAPGGAAATNPYLQTLEQDSARALRGAMQVSIDKQPDVEARLQGLARQYNLPVDAVRLDQPGVERRAKLDALGIDQFNKKYPSTTRFLSDPANAAVAHDDTQNLADIESTIGPISGPKASFGSVLSGLANSLPIGARMAREGIRMQLADAFGFDAVRDDAMRKYSLASLQADVGRPEIESPTLRGVYGGGESIVRMIPGLAASLLTRTPAPLLATMGAQTEADAYGKYRARGATAGQALAGAVGEGAIEVGTEMIPMSFMVNQFGKAGAGHFLAGLLAREIPSEQLATLTQDAVDTAIANPDKTWGQYLEERPGAAYQTLVATITQAGVMAAASGAVGRVQARGSDAQAAERDAAALAAMNDLAAASKLRARDPAAFQTFIKEAMADGPVQDVYISANTLAQSGVDVAALAQLSSAVAEQMNDAAATGGDIRIPVDEFAARIAGSDFAAAMLPHLKTDVGGMSQAEAQAYMQSQGADLQAEVAKALIEQQGDAAFKASRDEVTAQVLGQLTAAGRLSPDVNTAYATMMGSFYAVQAAKLGITPTEMAARYPLKVTAEVLGGARLDQGPTLDDVRQQWDSAGIKHGIFESSDRVTLSQIIVPDAARGAGKGTAAMQALIDYADAAGKHVVLSPSADFGGNKKRLTAFYKRFGFIENKGKNRAFTTSESMYRVAPGKVLEQGNRGSFNPETNTISLLAKADLSTFLHESGHFFLEVMADMASRPDAPAGITDDMDTVLKWFGVADLTTWNALDLEGKRESHEQFARGFEAYLFEGKAPNVEMQDLFSRFRAWMLNVYKSLKALNVELSADVRGVFDRMLATTETIVEAEAVRGYAGLFESKPDGMSDDEWRQYRDDTLGATQSAIHILETRSLRDMQWLTNAKSKLLSSMQRDARAKRKAIRAEVQAEVTAEPVNRARQLLKRGEFVNAAGEIDKLAGPNKLSIAALEEMYSGDGDRFALLDWEPLGYGGFGMLAKDGLAPDVVADMLGYASGDQMVRDLLTAEPARDKIEAITDQRMLERYGDLTDADSIGRAADAALHNDMRLRAVATEMNALHLAAGNRTVLVKAAKLYAEQTIARTRVADIKPNRYSAAASRAAKAADAAFKKGDIATAAQEKQNQLVNSYAAKAAYEARDEVRKTAERFRKMTTGKADTVTKTRDMDMVQATRAILAAYGVGTQGKGALEYLALVEANDPGMYAILSDQVAAATERAKPFDELTVGEMRALRDEVESLWYLARRSRQMEIDGDLMDREEVQHALRARLEEIGIPAEAPGEGHAITEAETRLSMMQSFRAAARRVESWVGAKDGTNKMGAFRKFVWNPVKEGADNYRVDKAKYLKAYRQLLDGVAPTLTQGKIAAPELNYTFGYDKGGAGKAELLHAILHTGNESNKTKLLLGRKWASKNEDGSVDTSRWDAFVDRMIAEGRLVKADFDFAQGVWDLLEKMKPQAQKTHRDVFGRYFDEVTADAFTNQFGSYAGGYVPAMADSRIVADAKTRALAEEENSTLQASFPSTGKGFTKARVDYNKPLLLDLRSLSGHIDKVLLFSHLEQPIRDVRRVLASSEVAYAINRIDPAAFDGLLTPWLNRTARQQVETPVSGSNGMMRFFSATRSRAGMAAMFANVSNSVQQVTGLSIALLKVKPKYLLAASAEFILSPRQVAAAVAAASPYMASRMENEVAHMSGAINDILLNPSVYENAKAWAARHAYFMQSAVDNVIGPMVWLGAYNEAMESAPAGSTDDQIKTYARRLADSAVRETQGSTLPEDISRLETGNAFVRLFTQFTGYFNMQANVLGTEFAKIGEDVGLRNGLGRGFYVLLFGFLAPAWCAELIAQAFRGGPPDEDRDGEYLDDWLAALFGWGTLRAATALVPVVGQGINAVANATNSKPYDDRVATSPAVSMIESAARSPVSVYDAIANDAKPSKAVRDVATLITLTTGLPASTMARPISYMADIADGRIAPTGPVDMARGAVTGAAGPQSKQ